MGEHITQDDEGNLVVTRPLLDELQGLRSTVDAGFSALGAKLDGKADKADVARMEGRLDAHGERLHALETWKHDHEVVEAVHSEHEERTWTKRQKVWGAVAAVASILAIIGGSFVGALVH